MAFCATFAAALGVAGLALAWSAPAAASPVTRTCDYHGPGKLGPLTVTVDEALKRVVVKTALGATWTMQDGVTAEYRPAESDDDSFGIETQFVDFKPDRVEVGIRDPDDGAMIHMSYFNRSALMTPPARCVWKSLWDFRRV
jgi:hypothetical protein